ncbi:hypothetical protein IU436_28335 [Nocardia farcinica]|uniref:hypothetical protein n=1 Tax=Nocardia TaxID=1817 RepID=UPI0018963B30|nr:MULTISPECIES: hypothetical protein [Nocardia]MBF6215791.1 hypothetical protein [Nocardia puris]MBF6260167.1 hypothetical protein [Nocardia farcinica]MBF6422598.1 hypothetical protein [Nocardia farcinica]MBF6434246.1 hypothetical protein [Nocardia farcinica]MBF6505330.1 hypothetical protein [Nocardia farcinica]
MDALGVYNLNITGTSKAAIRLARQTIELVAARERLTVVETMPIDPDSMMWISDLVEAVHRLGAHAVIAPDLAHLERAQRAVTGVADLLTPARSLRYVGYGHGYVRPSQAPRPVGRREPLPQ